MAYKYNYNRNAFKNIETEGDAYWLGFILADGYINVERRLLQIKLANKDRKHLEKFANYLNFQQDQISEAIKDCVGGAYTRDNPCCVIKIYDKNIMHNLLDCGLFQAKSGKEVPFKCRTPELERAYIRGIIDGDGYIGVDPNRMKIVGSKEVLEYIKGYINTYIVSTDTNSIAPKGKIYSLEFNGRFKAGKIIQYFYRDANFYLDRKYQLYLQTLQI